MGRLSPEWVWREHSTQYQFLAIELLRDFLKYKPGKSATPPSSTRWRGCGTPRVVRRSGGEYALLGDTQFAKAPEWGYNKGGSYKSQGLKAFRESGFAMVRQGGSYLATTAGFFNTTHKHADELDFELYDRGLKIVNGPGNYGYDREDQYRDYQLSGLAQRPARGRTELSDRGAERVRERDHSHRPGSGWFAIDGPIR